MRWRKRMYLMHVKNRARGMTPTAVSRRVAISWRVLHVSEYSAQSEIDILGAKHVSRTPNRIRRIRDVAVLVLRY